MLLPTFSDQHFSEEGTGGAALENAPVPYDRSIKKNRDARKCFSHNDSEASRNKRGRSPQSKSVQQMKPTGSKQSPRNAQKTSIAHAANTTFYANKTKNPLSKSCDAPPSGRYVNDKPPSTNGGKVDQTSADVLHALSDAAVVTRVSIDAQR